MELENKFLLLYPDNCLGDIFQTVTIQTVTACQLFPTSKVHQIDRFGFQNYII